MADPFAESPSIARTTGPKLGGMGRRASKRINTKDNLSPKLSYQESNAKFLLNSGVNLHARAVGPDPVHRAITLEDMSKIDSLDDVKVRVMI